MRARRFESEAVERDEPRALKLRPKVSPGKDERHGNAPHPTATMRVEIKDEHRVGACVERRTGGEDKTVKRAESRSSGSPSVVKPAQERPRNGAGASASITAATTPVTSASPTVVRSRRLSIMVPYEQYEQTRRLLVDALFMGAFDKTTIGGLCRRTAASATARPACRGNRRSRSLRGIGVRSTPWAQPLVSQR